MIALLLPVLLLFYIAELLSVSSDFGILVLFSHCLDMSENKPTPIVCVNNELGLGKDELAACIQGAYLAHYAMCFPWFPVNKPCFE
jgi:hypothetical protein